MSFFSIWMGHGGLILVKLRPCGPICIVHKPGVGSYLLEDLYALLLFVNAITDQISGRYP